MAPAERAAAWVRFAEEDLQMAGLALEEGIWNQVCFHARQAVEKLLKAFLEAAGERVPKMHSLAELGLRCQMRDAAFAAIRDDCFLLGRFYIPTRYPLCRYRQPRGRHAQRERRQRGAPHCSGGAPVRRSKTGIAPGTFTSEHTTMRCLLESQIG